MAIDRTGISSLDAGALDITYSGDEGPKSPNQIAGGEYNRVLELLEKVREDIPLSEEEKIELQGLIRTLTAKGINVEALMGGDTRMASVDPMLQDEYDKYVFELQEMHPEAVPMTIEQFREQAISGMADGGIARLGYQQGQLVQPGPGRPGYQGLKRMESDYDLTGLRDPFVPGRLDREGEGFYQDEFTGMKDPFAPTVLTGKSDYDLTGLRDPFAPTVLTGKSDYDLTGLRDPFVPGRLDREGEGFYQDEFTGMRDPFAPTVLTTKSDYDLTGLRDPFTGEYSDDDLTGLRDPFVLEKIKRFKQQQLINNKKQNFQEIIRKEEVKQKAKEQAAADRQAALQAQVTAQANKEARRRVSQGEARDYGKTETRASSGWESSPFEEGGIARLGYQGGEMVTVPQHWQSAPDHPKTELAYITDAEKNLLLKKDLHNSLKDGPNVGPGGVMSLNGTIGGQYYSGADISEAETGGSPVGMDTSHRDEVRAGFIAAGGNEGSTKGESPGVKKQVKEMKPSLLSRITSAPTDYRQKFFTKRIADKRKALMDKYNLTPQLAQQIIDMLDEDEGITVDKLRALDFGVKDLEGGISEAGINPFTKELGFHGSGKPIKGKGEYFTTPDLTSNPPGWLGVAQDKMIPEFNQLVSTATRIKDLESVLGTEAFKTGKGLQSEIDEYLAKVQPSVYGPEGTIGGPGRDDQPPIIYPYPLQASAPVVDETEVAKWEAPEIPVERLRLYSADGGRIPAAYGGIMGDDGRRRYGLGSIFKKAARGIKKVLKSPVGKAALMYGLGTWLGGTQAFGGVGGAGGFFSRLKNPALLKNLITPTGWSEGNILNPLLRSKGKDWTKGKPTWGGFDPWKTAIGLGSLYPLAKDFFTGGDDDEDFTQTDLYKRWLAQKQAADIQFAPVGDPANWQRQKLYADGGRIGYAGGGYYDEDEEDHRAAALAAMYRRGAQEGGLMDMGGMEKDYRQEGGFVPIGGQERADDVPARLSKNEFVFTADAVRAAGGGDIDAGAEVMENVMENLEQGGQVSEESQGLEGARNMFATAQRLEGVL